MRWGSLWTSGPVFLIRWLRVLLGGVLLLLPLFEEPFDFDQGNSGWIHDGTMRKCGFGCMMWQGPVRAIDAGAKYRCIYIESWNSTPFGRKLLGDS